MIYIYCIHLKDLFIYIDVLSRNRMVHETDAQKTRCLARRLHGRYVIREQERYRRLGEGVLGVRQRMINIPPVAALKFPRAGKNLVRIARAINDPLARSLSLARRIVHRAPGSWYRTISTRRWYTISPTNGGSRTPEMFPRNGRSFSRIGSREERER